MRVLMAETAGMCFGVRDALKKVASIESPEQVTIHGHLVHNEIVLTQLGVRGFHMVAEHHREDIPSTPDVLITAHGISDVERHRLESVGKTLIDTTCPLVARAHRIAKQLQSDGDFVLVIGRPNHVEVRGIVGDLESFAIVERIEAVERYSADRIGIVCQTTTPPSLAHAIHTAIVDRNPHATIRFMDTICAPTKANQQALEALLPKVDCMIVVGGRNSNNTRELVAMCTRHGVIAHQVVDATELRREWFAGVETVGLTAGTSTLDETLNEVRRKLESWGREPMPDHPWTSAEWCRFFEQNGANGLPLPWERGAELTDEERDAIGSSLQDFQLGESSEGTYFRRSAQVYADAIGDPEYARAIDLFIREEGRHSRVLGAYLDLAGLPRLEKSWTDGVFRRLRRNMPLEVVISVLLTAEMIAMAYYRAMHDATKSPLLRRLCAQLLRDERMHLKFHCEQLASARKSRSRWRLAMTHWTQRALLAGTCVVVWWRHAKAFRKGGFTFRRLWRVTHDEFRHMVSEAERQRQCTGECVPISAEC